MRECSSLQRLCVCTLPRVTTVFSTLASTALLFFLAITASFRSVLRLVSLPRIQAASASFRMESMISSAELAVTEFRSDLQRTEETAAAFPSGNQVLVLACRWRPTTRSTRGWQRTWRALE